MRYGLGAALVGGVLLLASAGFAADTPSHIEGSGQGGYLGANPGAHVQAPQQAPQIGSLQGGYLGKNPGADMQPKKPGAAVDASSPPTAFCDSASIEPGRCRSRAEVDHKMCADRADSAHYMSCRRTLDLFGWRL
jgi:hypothetical protein